MQSIIHVLASEFLPFLLYSLELCSYTNLFFDIVRNVKHHTDS